MMPSKSEMVLDNFVNGNITQQNILESTKIKEENFEDDKTWDFDGSYEDNSDSEKIGDDGDSMANLPLEVITTVEPSSFPYPTLKNMSNGVLTHRNIFTEQERDVLRNIVEKYRSIVDTRRRTRETYLEKQTVWQQIVEEFNGSTNVMMRTEKELKKCWDNMKYRARLAEKEQQRADNFCSIIKNSQEVMQTNNNTVQAAIEKMLSMQSTTVDEGFSSLLHQDEDQRSSEDGYQADSRDESDQDAINDDEQPLLKKARQESPKLSSILLGEAKKSSKNEIGHYNIPNCTKVTHMKKKHKKLMTNPVSILPKGLNSCVSIMNIPNPNLVQQVSEEVPTNASDFTSSFGAINLGGGVTIAPQKLPDGSNVSHVKPMPNLRKMLSPKNNLNKSLKLSSNLKNNFAQNEYQSNSKSNESIEEKILLRRLEFDEQEHKIKMKILEKQLLAYSNEALYWDLKMKLLKSGQDGIIGKMKNGTV